MKRLEIQIEDDLDAALEQEARREGVSKAELVRRYVRERVKPVPPLEDDPLWELFASASDADPVDDIDDFLYGPKAKP
jgi:Ribbon-helix-helix protein, copG family